MFTAAFSICEFLIAWTTVATTEVNKCVFISFLNNIHTFMTGLAVGLRINCEDNNIQDNNSSTNNCGLDIPICRKVLFFLRRQQHRDCSI